MREDAQSAPVHRLRVPARPAAQLPPLRHREQHAINLPWRHRSPHECLRLVMKPLTPQVEPRVRLITRVERQLALTGGRRTSTLADINRSAGTYGK